MLAGLPGLVGAVQQAVACELVAGHEGSHVAFTVASDDGDRPWWIAWSRRRFQVITIDVCTHETEDHDRDTCLLPAEHPGPHSYQLVA